MSEQSKIDAERAAFEAFVVREWPTAQLHYVRDALPKTDPRYGEYCDESLQRAWVGWQARASQPVGVPDGSIYVECRQCDECQHCGINDAAVGLAACHECDWTGPDPVEDKCPGCQSESCMAAACPKCGSRYAMVSSEDIAAPAAPTVKAEQGDCLYCQGHGEVTRTSGQTAESYSEHNEECPECQGTGLAPSLPAAGSADQPYPEGIAEDLERSDWTPLEALQWYAAGKHFDVVGGRTRIIDTGAVASNALKHASLAYLELKGDAELSELRAALSAQQSAPERVSVPRDLLADLISSDHDTKIQAERALYALLASHAEGGKV